MIRTVIGVVVLAVGAAGAIRIVQRRWTFLAFLGTPERRHSARMVATIVMAAVFFAGFTMIGLAFLASASQP